MGAASSTYYERKKASREDTTTETKMPLRGRPVTKHSLTVCGNVISNAQIEEWLMELVSGEEHSYGYLLLTECLHVQRQLIINKKKVYRLCKKLGILHPQRRKKVHYPRRLARNHTITGSNQVWQLDIKYGYVAGYDQFFYIADMIDVYDRSIVGIHIGTNCEAKHVCEAVKKALQSRLKPEESKPIIRTDNGPQFISKAFGELCEAEGIMHERIPPKTPNMNAYIESFHATLERDLLGKESFESFQEAHEAVRNYIDFYNNRRMHRSLGKRSPTAFMKWVEQTTDSLEKYTRAV
ncbi:IS3 family transposase [Cohnella herbarum]|uniref:IS3 family transposase n=1 Tax=Cohnella herbarum TaxID=2728023 RepID=A0A7Z2ZNP9_9BACL|nr:IS3 family transposase [Cohnella herbarum]QJD81951.1 IS3 family transposase [Cohnella herbarum]QJD82096.1 IS3 family transposase [Cohnella herbarum]QJD82264.1 IS3 family transposase [Cohnella herbarum]QJD82665.1 IS3 family transposase [Cohnella herbarum]QJD83773.1 IS3 family transposase [Cohnella herbarum]